MLLLVFAFALATTASAQTTITDPASQGMFRWTAAPGATHYELDLGSGFVSIGNVVAFKLAPSTPDGRVYSAM